MYTENEDFEEDYNESSNSGSFMDKAKDFYDSNKKMVLILGGLLLLLIILLMMNSCSNQEEPSGGNSGGNSPEIKLIVSPTDKNLSVGNSIRMNAQCDQVDDFSLQWESSDPTVASVDALGNVNALKLGTTTITASFKHTNGETYKGEAIIVVSMGDKGVDVKNVSFPDGELLITYGDTHQLLKQVEPSNGYIEKIVYTSSNTTIVEVDDNGVVKALKEGVATITMSVNNDKFKDELIVNVVTDNVEPQMIVNPNMITFNNAKVNLTIGESKELTYQYLPKEAYIKQLRWSSSDEKVAKVDQNGMVTAIGEGSAIITVKTSNDKEATVVIEVEKGVVNVESISVLSATSLTMNVNETNSIVVNVLPSNATNTGVTYSSSNPSVATVESDGKIRAFSAGSTTITIKTIDGGKTATVSVVVINNSSSDSGSSGGSNSGSSGGSSSGSSGSSSSDKDESTSNDSSNQTNFVASFPGGTSPTNKGVKYVQMNIKISNPSTSNNNAIYFCVDQSNSTAKSPTSAEKISYWFKDYYVQPSNTCNRDTGLTSGYWNTYVPSGSKVCIHVEVDGVKHKENCVRVPS